MDPQALSPGAGSPSFRIFISSPGDVATERDRAKDVVNQLARWYGASVTLVPVLWEDLPLTVEMPFQDQIDVVARSVDIAVFIVWSKIGTPVTVAGKHYHSGTEREFDLMLRTLESTGGDRPDVLFYHRRDDQGFDDRLQSTDDDGKLRLIEQKKLAAAFVQEHFWSPEGNVRAYHSFQRPVDFAGRLKVHLRGLIDQRLDRAGVSPQVVWTDEPYRGLDVFDLQHATIFFGRETEVAELEQRCRDRHRAVLESLAGGSSRNTVLPGIRGDASQLPCAFVAVIGASGSGKSSLVRAGLRASLIDYNLDESVQEWRTVVLVPGQSEGQPLGALVRAIAETDGALPELRDGSIPLASLTESLGRAPRDAVNLGFAPVFQRLSGHAGGRVQLLIVIDQFEELFTGNRIGETQRENFLHALQALAQSGWCWVVATLRSDFYPLAQRSEAFLQMKGDTGQFDLLPPGPDALRRIITEPARLAGVSFEQRAQELGGQSLAARILQDTQGQADLLPLLSDCLLELYRRRTAENVLTFAEYERLGNPAKGISGLEGALTHRAEQVFQSLSAEQQALFPGLLHALINVEANSDAFALRRRAQKDALASDRDSAICNRKSAILSALIQARLLTAEGDAGSGTAAVSLAHEALLRKWDRIAGWVRENRQFLQIRSRVEQSQKRWETQGKRDDLLLPEGLDLEEGLSLLKGAPQLIQGAEYDGTRDYVSRSFAFHDRRHRRARHRRRMVISTLVLLTAVSLVGAAVAFLKEREAKANLLDALFSDARAQMKGLGTGWWWKSMDNFRKAAALDVPMRDRTKLRETAIACMGASTPCFQLLKTLESHKGTVRSVAVSADGQFLASASEDGTVKIWSMEDGKELGAQASRAPITSVAIHPNSRLVAFSPGSGKIRFWEKADVPGADGGWGTSSSPQETEVGHGFVSKVAFCPDGQWLAAACQDGTVCLIPVPSGARKIQTLRGHGKAVICAAFSPDGKQLATGSEDKTIQFWNVATGLKTRTWTTANHPFTLAWSPDGYTVAWADLDSRGFSWRYLWGADADGRAQLHAGSVLDLSFSDAGRIVTASEDGTLQLWTRREFAGLAVAEGEFDSAWSVAPSPDRTRVVAGYRDGCVRIWQLGDPPQQPGEPQRAFPGGTHGVAFQANSRRLVAAGSVYDFTLGLTNAGQAFQQPAIEALAAHPNGETVALGRPDGTLAIWDYRQPRELLDWEGHRDGVTSLAASPDGTKLASAGVDGKVKVWSWESGRLDREWEPGLGAIHQVVWSDDGQQVALAAEQGVATCNLTGQSAPRIVVSHPLELGGVAFGSNTLAFAGLNGFVEIHDLQSGKQLRELPGHGAPVSALAFSRDRSLLATAAPDKTIRIWDMGAGAPKRVLSFEGLSPSWMAFTPNGKYLLTGGPFRGGGHTGTNLWDIETGRKAAWIGPGFYSSGQCLPDGSGFLLGAQQGALRQLRMADIESKLRRAASGDPIPLDSVSQGLTILPGGHTDAIWGVAASPNGRWIATASHDRTVKLWDAKTLKLVRSLEGHAGLVWCVAFSPDSKWLASGSGEIILWEVSNGRAIGQLTGHTALISSLAFHPNGRWLLSSSRDGTIRVWDLLEGRRPGVLCGFNEPVHGVVFRPDGRWLAAACGDRNVALWDLETVELGRIASSAVAPTRTLQGHTSPVWSVAFDPQGKYLASGAGQGAVILWDGDTFERVIGLKAENNDVRSLSFSGDGRLLAAAVYAKQAIVWDLAEMRRTLRDLRLDWGPAKKGQ